ncbi:MAG: hypothetical protein KAW12_22720, partial [Candidatus Aminicenantes bacterium]|nr:hypothetical protein [Candidatus Aminicenantes bacterium]
FQKFSPRQSHCVRERLGIDIRFTNIRLCPGIPGWDLSAARAAGPPEAGLDIFSREFYNTGRRKK